MKQCTIHQTWTAQKHTSRSYICVHANKKHVVKYINVTKTTIQNDEKGKLMKFGPLLYMQSSGANWIMMYSFS